MVSTIARAVPLYNIIVSKLFCYRDGRPLTNTEITGMCIGLLMAGQHTSSSTSSWLGFFLAQNKELQVSHHDYRSQLVTMATGHVTMTTGRRYHDYRSVTMQPSCPYR